MPQTQSRSFHLHVDATYMPEEFYRILRNHPWCFRDSEFSGHPEGYQHFEPNRHVTLKFPEGQGREFRRTCAELEGLVHQFPDFKGYFEGEYIREERLFPETPYRDLPVPFKINRRRLDGSSFEQFRESELHLTLDKDASNPKLIKKLLDAGLYGAYLPKADYVALVLTIQGFRDDIGRLVESLWEYVSASGGATKAKLKEEAAIWYRLYGVSAADLPEIAGQVIYL